VSEKIAKFSCTYNNFFFFQEKPKEKILDMFLKTAESKSEKNSSKKLLIEFEFIKESLKTLQSELSPDEIVEMESLLSNFERKKNYLLRVKKAYQDSAIFFTNIDEADSRYRKRNPLIIKTNRIIFFQPSFL
jgi:hypothetical protein